jgi:hypothetical protein
MRKSFSLAFASAVLAALIVGAVSAQAATDFSGKWVVSGTMEDEVISPTCTFAQNNGELSGSCKGPSGLGSLDGAADGQSIVWHWKRVATNSDVGDATITFRGTLGSDGVIRGQWKDDNVDDEVGTFVAQRLKP